MHGSVPSRSLVRGRVARAITSLRLSRGLSREQLAAQLGWQPIKILHIERTDITAPMSDLRRIVDTLPPSIEI
ncbi:helix-turn-helix domain-containing protein [Paractinoplanes abujensis]